MLTYLDSDFVRPAGYEVRPAISKRTRSYGPKWPVSWSRRSWLSDVWLNCSSSSLSFAVSKYPAARRIVGFSALARLPAPQSRRAKSQFANLECPNSTQYRGTLKCARDHQPIHEDTETTDYTFHFQISNGGGRQACSVKVQASSSKQWAWLRTSTSQIVVTRTSART
jgi:hypothetical protein